MSTKPVKRSQQLAPLSREHHDALLFVLKIKKGLKNGTNPEEIAQYIKWYWQNNLRPHFDLEEKTLLPHLATGDKLAKQLIEEHKIIRELITGVKNDTLSLIAETLNDHIRFEERKLFPHIENILSADDLDKIYSQLNVDLKCESTWEHEFWVTKE